MKPFAAPPIGITIHCSAQPNGMVTSVEAIRREHMTRKPVPFSDIGYHWVILNDGTVAQGRDERLTGAHVDPKISNANKNELAICMIGTDKFRLEQWNALSAKVRQLMAKYPSILKVDGHRDHSPDANHNGKIDKFEWVKLCPGFDVMDWIKNSMRPLPDHILN